MCFPIKKDAKRPRNRYVYKLVERRWDNRGYTGPYYKTLEYIIDKVSSIKLRAKTQSLGRAHEGLYVYLTLDAARRERHLGARILKCEVSPDDWIVSATYARQATYRRLKPIGFVRARK
jgi:hypothetical protein